MLKDFREDLFSQKPQSKKEWEKMKWTSKNEAPIFLNHLWFWSKCYKFSEITEEMKEKEEQYAEQFSY